MHREETKYPGGKSLSGFQKKAFSRGTSEGGRVNSDGNRSRLGEESSRCPDEKNPEELYSLQKDGGLTSSC